jgi:hypothetical protein
MTAATVTMMIIGGAGGILVVIGLVIMLLSLFHGFKRYVSEVASRFPIVTDNPGRGLAGIGVSLIILEAIISHWLK